MNDSEKLIRDMISAFGTQGHFSVSTTTKPSWYDKLYARYWLGFKNWMRCNHNPDKYYFGIENAGRWEAYYKDKSFNPR